nr:hypothetical protein [Thiothrix litoralis]
MLGSECIGDTATCSNGDKLERGDFYRNLEAKLGIAQRAKQKKRVKAIHAKIKNKRNDALQKFTTKLVCEDDTLGFIMRNLHKVQAGRGVNAPEHQKSPRWSSRSCW